MLIFSASELARSVLAGVTARTRQFSLEMNCSSISLMKHGERPSVFQSGPAPDQCDCSYRIWYSMSTGWSPTATFVMPGRSISVRFNTETEKVQTYAVFLPRLVSHENLLFLISNNRNNRWYARLIYRWASKRAG